MMKNNYIKQKRKDQNPVNHWKIFEGRLVFLLAMVILAVVAYTFILQQAYTKTALKTEIERDISSADAVHKLVNDRLGRKDFNEIQNASTLHVFCKHGLHFQTHPFFYSKKHPVPTAITYTVFCGNAFFRLQSIHAGSDSFFYIGPVIYMENFKGTGI